MKAICPKTFEMLDEYLSVDDPCSDPMPHNPGDHMCVGSEGCDGVMKEDTAANRQSDAIEEGLEKLALDMPMLTTYVEVAGRINDEATTVMGSLVEIAKSL